MNGFALKLISHQMAVFENFRFCLTVISLCILWYSVSSTAGVLNKTILGQYSYPLTVSMVSLLSISLYSIPVMYLYKLNNTPLSIGTKVKYILPISIGKVIAVSTAYVSLWKIPVSYAHTVKATMPIFAVFFARVLLGEVQSFKVYLSLIPIVCGVAIASLTELSFNAAGLFSALCSTLTYALLNTLAKKVFKETHLHPLKLLSMTAQIATVMFLPFWCLHDLLPLWKEFAYNKTDSQLSSKLNDFLVKLLASGTLSFVQNLIAFTLIHKLTALSYAVANTTKRITVVTVSLLMLKNPVTSLNVFGMMLAIFGVFGYNQVKRSERTGKPLTHMNLSDLSLESMGEGSRSGDMLYKLGEEHEKPKSQSLLGTLLRKNGLRQNNKLEAV